MKTTPKYMVKITWGFILSALIFAGVIIFLRNSPVLWEFLLSRHLPNFQVTDLPARPEYEPEYEPEIAEPPPPPRFYEPSGDEDEIIVKILEKNIL